MLNDHKIQLCSSLYQSTMLCEVFVRLIFYKFAHSSFRVVQCTCCQYARSLGSIREQTEILGRLLGQHRAVISSVFGVCKRFKVSFESVVLRCSQSWALDLLTCSQYFVGPTCISQFRSILGEWWHLVPFRGMRRLSLECSTMKAVLPLKLHSTYLTLNLTRLFGNIIDTTQLSLKEMHVIIKSGAFKDVQAIVTILIINTY
jgi:hypothetical protein